MSNMGLLSTMTEETGPGTSLVLAGGIPCRIDAGLRGWEKARGTQTSLPMGRQQHRPAHRERNVAP
jgi:hypothetical protein